MPQTNKNQKYRATVVACYIAYTVQAIVNNTSPILFTLYNSEFGVSLAMLANIILINFVTQLLCDLLSIKLLDIFGYRKLAVTAHILSALGIICLSILPRVMPSAAGLVIATALCALGSGMIEVIISPIVDAIPSDNKSGSLTFLHSFYCWGSVLCVGLGTLAVKLLGKYWYTLPLFFAIIPAVNAIVFTRVKFARFTEENTRVPVRKLLSSRLFILMMVIMVCGGASELVISQWSSLFAEKALGVSKIVGDILGPCLFAAFMGTGRMLSGILSRKIKIEKIMLFCAFMCFFCYLGTALLPNMFSLAACAVTGLFVSLMWPATLSVASESFEGAGTTLFSILAFAGDVGCSFGPWLAGNISDLVRVDASFLSLSEKLSLTPDQLGLRAGILVSAIFPLIMFIAIAAVMRNKTSKNEISLN